MVRQKDIKLIWTPAHVGVTGNENVDCLARLTNILGGDFKDISSS